MRFHKMHGIGNDYVYVDCIRQPMPDDPAALSRRVSDPVWRLVDWTWACWVENLMVPMIGPDLPF